MTLILTMATCGNVVVMFDSINIYPVLSLAILSHPSRFTSRSWRKLTYPVLTCRLTPNKQTNKQSGRFNMHFYWAYANNCTHTNQSGRNVAPAVWRIFAQSSCLFDKEICLKSKNIRLIDCSTWWVVSALCLNIIMIMLGSIDDSMS